MMLFSRLLGGAFLALMLAAPAARAADPAALLPVLPVSRSLTPTAEALPGAPRQAGLPAASGDGLRLLAADDRSVEFELELGPLEFEPGPGGVAIRARGADRLAEPGEPDLPARELFIGLPQTGEVSFSADGSAPLAQSGVTVRPARAYDGRAAVAATVGRDGPWPARLVELVEILDVRGRRVARVRLNPVRYDAARQELSGYRRLKVTARFEHEPRGRAAPDRFEPVLARALLNGAAAAGWRRADDPTPAGLPGAPRQAGLPAGGGFFDRSDDWCKVRTETTGVYRVRGADLAAAGYDLALIDPATLKVFSPGEWEMNGPYPDTMFEVPVLVSAANPDRFGPDDYLAFYAESPSNWRTDSAGNRYWQTNYFTRYRPWWLTWGGAPGRRFPELAAGGATSPARSVRRRARLEVDRLCPARSGLLWLWERYVKVAGRDTALFRRPLDLPGLDSIEQVSGRLYGVKSAGDRTLNYFTRVRLGELLLDTVVVTPRDRVPPPADFSFPVAGAAGRDTLTFELYGEPQTTIYLDWLEVTYRARLELTDRARFLEFGFEAAGTHEFGIEGGSDELLLLDVTDPFRPRRLTGTSVSGRRRDARVTTAGPARFCAAPVAHLRSPVSVEQRAPGRLLAAADRADYYIISPDEFYPAARLFARYRDGNIAGLPAARAEAARLSEIYDDYGFGVEEPGAIKQLFVARRPTYGLFAGDATYDYRNCLGGEYPPMVPAYQVGFDVDPEVYGQTARAYDAWYADFDGDGRAPDMVLGRITARSAVELRQYLDKVRTYETQALGLWAKRFLLLADDEYEGSPDRPDPIGFSHISGCEQVYNYARHLLDPVKVYLTEYPLTGVNDKAGARAEFNERIEQGALFWAFFGHGAGFQLTHERVLHIDGIGAVGGGSRNSIAFFGSCGVGRFDDTRYEAVAEELVRKAEGGCIATVAATKATTPGPNERFAREMFGGMLDQPGLPVGPAFFGAWLSYTIYNFFGDPALLPRIPEPGRPVAAAPDTLFPGGTLAVTNPVPVTEGMYGISVRELDWQRYYRSDYGATQYVLPGYELHTAVGSFTGGALETSFRVCSLDYPDTTIVGNGSYVRLPGTGTVSVLAWDGREGYAAAKSDLPLGPARPGSDREPPAVRLFADDIELRPGDTTSVPAEFTLRGELEDESGILLAPVPHYGLALVVGGRTQDRVGLSNLFRYHLNSVTRGAFSYPYKSAQTRDSLTVFAADNFLNRLVATWHIRTGLNEPLRIDSALVWPNPAAGEALFTFRLTRAAFIGVKVFTISGRLVRQLPPALCGFGYNQLAWDGRDAHGNLLANGIYLYKLDARAADAGAGSSTAGFRDKLVVFR